MKNENRYSVFSRKFSLTILAVVCCVIVSSGCWAAASPVYGLNGFGGVTGYNATTGAQLSYWSGGLNTQGAIDFNTAVVPVPGTLFLLGSGFVGLFGLMRRNAAS